MKSNRYFTDEENRFFSLVERFLDSLIKVNETLTKMNISIETLVHRQEQDRELYVSSLEGTGSINSETVNRILEDIEYLLSDIEYIKGRILDLESKNSEVLNSLRSFLEQHFSSLRKEILDDRKFLLEERKIDSNIEIAKINSQIGIKTERSKFFYGIIGGIISAIGTLFLSFLASYIFSDNPSSKYPTLKSKNTYFNFFETKNGLDKNSLDENFLREPQSLRAIDEGKENPQPLLPAVKDLPVKDLPVKDFPGEISPHRGFSGNRVLGDNKAGESMSSGSSRRQNELSNQNFYRRK